MSSITTIAAPVTSPDSNSTTSSLPALDSKQSVYAHAIISEAKSEDVGNQGCMAAIATAYQESKLRMYANEAVPESMNIKHDAVGHDYDSVGVSCRILDILFID
jgi:hypothetical protein